MAIADELKQTGHCSYVYLGAGWHADDFNDACVLAYDRETNYPEGFNVLFGDGHTEWYNPPSLRQRLAETKQHLFAATQPTTLPTVPILPNLPK